MILKRIHLTIILFWGVTSLSLFIASCKHSTPNQDPQLEKSSLDTATTANITELPQKILPEGWKEITQETGIQLEIAYASQQNFTKNQIYPCARCMLRPELADKIIQIHNDIRDRYGYGLKLYDCYRPRPAQQKLWDIVPDARYVTPPHKGSMHNRGLAVDITIVDKDGKELDMGTDYDHFGHEAYTDRPFPNTKVEGNRQLLYKLMQLHGLSGIRTEWWHYSLKTVSYPLDNWVWECP